MTMHQILKIDERNSFLMISVEIGEKYLTPKNQQMVQQPHQHFCKFLNPPCHYYLYPIINSLVIKKSYHAHLAMN